MKKYVLDLNVKQLKILLKSVVEEEYRINQVIEWIYLKKVSSFKEFTNIPKKLRDILDDKFVLRALKVFKKEHSTIDGTTKYTFQSTDKKLFFAVLIPNNGKNSVCISSQIGCPVKCVFCFSGKVKFVRNLSRGEIIEQFLQIENDTFKKISRVLFMGMGEPMLNFNNVFSGLNSILSNKEFGISKRHITISSVGIVPAIKKLADSNLGIRLAISLNFVDEKLRKKFIGNDFGFSIKDILNSGKYYIKKTNSHLTIEYILLSGINDSTADAHKFARLLKQCELINPNVQVNLIPFNPVSNIKFKMPTVISVQKFKSILKLSRIIVNVRKIKGTNICAACGQLGYY
jgi:23S rRNA (adenine2503-C2)-methyltransferase